MADRTHAELLREYLELLSQTGGESRMPRWKDWLRARVSGAGAVALGAALSLVACDGDITDPVPVYGAPMGGAGGSVNPPSKAGASGTVDPAPSEGGSAPFTNIALYSVPIRGGASGTVDPAPNEGGSAPFTVIALYSAPHRGGASSVDPLTTGGDTTTPVTKYGIPMGGVDGKGGTSSVDPLTTGGNTTTPVTKYGIPMGGVDGKGGTTSTTLTTPITRYAAPMGGRPIVALYAVVMDPVDTED